MFVSIAVSAIAISLNWQYFRPEHFYYNMTDVKKLSGQSFIDQQAGAILDYLPKTALEPKELAPSSPLTIEGNAVLTDFIKASNRWAFRANVKGSATIDVPVFDFPNWVTQIDGKVVSHSVSFPTGRIEIQIPAGKYEVNGIFKNTPIRTFSNLLSLVSLLALLSMNRFIDSQSFGNAKNRKSGQ